MHRSIINAAIRSLVRLIGVCLGAGCLALALYGAPFQSVIIGVFLILLSSGGLGRIIDAFKEEGRL